MIPSTILAYPARVLKRDQRENYINYGYTSVEMVIPPSKWLYLRRKVGAG